LTASNKMKFIVKTRLVYLLNRHKWLIRFTHLEFKCNIPKPKISQVCAGKREFNKDEEIAIWKYLKNVGLDISLAFKNSEDEEIKFFVNKHDWRDDITFD